MTKNEAIEAMEQGHKVRHRSFTDKEWMKQHPDDDNRYLFEDGYTSAKALFWDDRKNAIWTTGWEIVEDGQ